MEKLTCKPRHNWVSIFTPREDPSGYGINYTVKCVHCHYVLDEITYTVKCHYVLDKQIIGDDEISFDEYPIYIKDKHSHYNKMIMKDVLC